VPQPEEAMAAPPPHASDRAALIDRLLTFADSARDAICGDIHSWVESEFSGDWAAVAAAAEGGDAKATFAMLNAPHLSREEKGEIMLKLCPDQCLDCALSMLLGSSEEAALAIEKDGVMLLLKLPLASGSATAQFVKGMLHYIFDCDSGAQEDFLDAARWIRKAAKQKLKVRCLVQFT
jgi:hypothetical protein